MAVLFESAYSMGLAVAQATYRPPLKVGDRVYLPDCLGGQLARVIKAPMPDKTAGVDMVTMLVADLSTASAPDQPVSVPAAKVRRETPPCPECGQVRKA
jgi:hypothetical protein